jgi:competence protein ComEC
MIRFDTRDKKPKLYDLLVLTVAVAALLAAFLLRKEEERRFILPLCSPVVLLCAAILFTLTSHRAPRLTVTALDVGQGASTAFYSAGRTALVDCGGDGLTNPGDLAADHFQSLGTSRLDLLVLTHLDDDHYNGVPLLFARMEIGAVALPAFDDGFDRREEVEALARAEGAQLYFVEEVLDVTLGESVFTLFPPMGKGTTNEEGLFVLCSAGEFDALITGDADSAVEAMLVKYRSIPDVELLMVGHHGSNNSTSAQFLSAVRPEYAVISSGWNSYGHPHPDVLDRLAGAGAEVYRTDLHGAITLTVQDDGSAVPQGGF